MVATTHENILQRGLNRMVLLVGPLATFGVIAFVFARIGDLAMLATRVLLGKHLQDTDFGAIDPVLSTLTLLSIPATFFCQSATKTISRLNAAQEPQQCAALVRHFFILMLVGGLAISLLVWLISPVLLSRLHLEDYQAWLPLFLAAWIALAWGQQLFSAIFQGLQRFVMLSMLGALAPIILAVLTLIFIVFYNTGLTGALVTRLASGLLVTILAAWVLRGFIFAPRASYRTEWPTIKQALVPAILMITSTTLLISFDKLFVRNFLPDDSGGLGAIITLGQIPMWFLLPLVTVLLPLVSAEHAAGSDVSRWLTQAVAIGTVVTVGSALLFGIAATPLFAWWKPSFVPYANLVWPYALAMGLHAVILLVVNFEFARHEYGSIVWLTVVSCISCAALYLLRGSITLPIIVWAQAVIRIVILAGIMPLIWWRTKGRAAT